MFRVTIYGTRPDLHRHEWYRAGSADEVAKRIGATLDPDDHNGTLFCIGKQVVGIYPC